MEKLTEKKKRKSKITMSSTNNFLDDKKIVFTTPVTLTHYSIPVHPITADKLQQDSTAHSCQ
jgi:hypothetical protein